MPALASVRRFLSNRPLIDLALKAAAWAVIVVGVYQVVSNPYSTQWDFKLYVTCAKAQSMGLNPYDDVLVRKTLGYGWNMPCLYPPAVLSAYKPFAAQVDEHFHRGSARVQVPWALLKLAMIAGLIALWRRYLNLKHEAHLLLFLLIAFGNPIYIDLRSGNVAMLEQLLLWSGFACFIAGKDFWFAACVIAAAQFKLTPAAFLALLLFRRRPQWAGFAAACLGFAGVFALNYVFHPSLTPLYFEKLIATSDVWAQEAGTINCSTAAFVRDFSRLLGLSYSDLTRAWLMLLLNAAIAAVSGWACYRRRRAAAENQELELVLFASVVYALLVPRLKDYSYIIMLPPTLYALTKIESPRWKAALLTCVCLNSLKGLGVKLGLGQAAALLAYFKWYAIVMIWAHFTLRFARSSQPDRAGYFIRERSSALGNA